MVPTGTSLTAAKVTFGGTVAALSVVGDAQIAATVPAGATTGLIAVTAPGGTAESAASFIVIPEPRIARLRPESAMRRATVTIGRLGFVNGRGAGFVTFGVKTCVSHQSWSTTRIKCSVPGLAAEGCGSP